MDDRLDLVRALPVRESTAAAAADGAAAADSDAWEYGARPLSSRKVSAAREYWSARGSSGSPCACSGATNDGVPAIIVSREDMSSALPRPRSATIARTWSSTVRNSTLAGFTSRCSTPRSCSAWSPAPTWRTTSSACAGDSPSTSSRSARVPWSAYDITR